MTLCFFGRLKRMEALSIVCCAGAASFSSQSSWHRKNFFWFAFSPQPIVIHLLTFDFILERENSFFFSSTSRSPFSGSMRSKCTSRCQSNDCRKSHSKWQTHNDIKWQIAEKNYTLSQFSALSLPTRPNQLQCARRR